MTTDEFYMHRCLHLARLGEYYVAPNPMVGALLVQDGHIVAEGWHRQYGSPHAEVNCFADAEAKGITDFSRCTLYVSLEPCSHYGKTPPCANLIVAKHPKRVVVGHLDPNPRVSGRGIDIVRQAGIEVTVGVAESECRALNKRFLCLQEKKRPYVILKWAQTADGFIDFERPIDLSNRKPLVISTPLTKQLVHKMRAENMSILVGTRTALLDNPRLLTTRWPGRNPIRLVLDRHDQIPQDSKIFSDEAPTIVYHDNTDWRFILADLAERNIHSVLVEGGTTLLNAILTSGIYDEIHVEISPMTIQQGVQAPVISHLKPHIITTINGNYIYEYAHD